MRLLGHGAKSLHQENAVNGFSQRQCWRLVLLDQADLSKFTQRLVLYLIVILLLHEWPIPVKVLYPDSFTD